jgi:hypothetical protein
MLLGDYLQRSHLRSCKKQDNFRNCRSRFLVDETRIVAPIAVDFIVDVMISDVHTTIVSINNIIELGATWRYALPGNDIAKLYARVVLACNISVDVYILCAFDVADLNAVVTGKNSILDRDGFGIRVVENYGKNHKAS